MAQETSLILQFSFFVLFALLGTVLSIRLRQPYVVGLLIFGMLSGPNVLKLVTDTSLIGTFSELGAILLLFAVGIEFSITKMIRSGFRAIIITIFKMGVLFFFGYELALYFGLDLTAALFVGAMVSITSTSIMFKIVSQKGLSKNPTLPLLFSMLIVEDIVAVIALTFFSSLTFGTAAPTYEDKFISVVISLAILGGFYLLVRKPAASAIYRLTSTLNDELIIFVSFTICLLLSMLAAFMGLSPAIGAFLAGSIVASLPNSRKIEKTIKPLILLFAGLFFLSLGMQIDPVAVLENLPFAAMLVLVFVLVGFFSILFLLYSTGATIQNSVFGASAMVVLGEFSLLIAAEATGQYSSLLLSVGSFGVIATAIISSFLLDRQPAILSLGQRHTPSKLGGASSAFSVYFSGLIRDFSPNGSFWRVSVVCWRCIVSKLAWIVVIAIIVLALYFSISFFGIASGAAAVQLRGALAIAGGLGILYYLFGIFRDIRPMLDAISRIIARHKKDAKDEAIILRDLAIAASLILLALFLIDFVSYTQLPSLFSWADEVLFFFAFAFLWDLMRHAGRLHRRRANGR